MEIQIGRNGMDEYEDGLAFRLGDWKWIPVYEVGDRAYHVYTIIK